MCISTQVSFGLSGLLLATGGYCVVKASHGERRLLPLAVIPLIFSIQQFCEGWVWVGINQPNPQLLKCSAIVFLFFALFLWPIWIPFSTIPMERRRNVRTFLWVITVVGGILGAFLFLPILMHPDWLTVDVMQRSVHYDASGLPILNSLPDVVWQLTYLAVTAVPLFVSRVRRVFNFGIAVVLSAAVSHVFFRYAAASIWCFMAAGMSVYLSGLFFKLPGAMRVVVGPPHP